MSPICFTCTKFIPMSPVEICDQIADMSNWRDFNGYGPLPGIERAEYERRTETMVGSRIHVYNKDCSEHVEEIVEWDASQHVTLRLCEFTPPFSHLATHIIEEWNLAPTAGGTQVERSFQLFPKRATTRPLLWGISQLFRRAIDQHLDVMAQ